MAMKMGAGDPHGRGFVEVLPVRRDPLRDGHHHLLFANCQRRKATQVTVVGSPVPEPPAGGPGGLVC